MLASDLASADDEPKRIPGQRRSGLVLLFRVRRIEDHGAANQPRNTWRKRSRHFEVVHSGGLGWTPVFENKEIIFFQTGGMVFALFLRDKLAEDFQVDPATFGRAAVALAYNVSAKNEVDPLINKAVAAGATNLNQREKPPGGGYSGYFADPDGFAWEVAWNPGWRLAPDGSVKVR